MREESGYVLLLAIVVVMLVWMSPVKAEIDASASVVSNTYNKTADAGVGFQFRVGTKDQPFYLFGEYEDTTIRLLGQPMYNTSIMSAGIGAVKRLNDIELFIELGYAITDGQVKSLAIQNEMVYTQLLNNHENDGRPAPANDPAKPNSGALTSYEVGDGYVGRIGVRYEVIKHVHLTAAYRVLGVKEHMEWWDVNRRARGGGWWQESNRLNLNSAQFGIVFSY